MAPSNQPSAVPPAPSLSQPTSPSTSISTSISTPTPQWHGTPPIVHYSAFAALILAPAALMLPSARGRATTISGLQNLVLFGSGFWGMNQLAYDFSGKSIIRRTNDRMNSMTAGLTEDLPAKARQNKALMEAERARRLAALPEAERVVVEKALREREERREEARRGPLGRLWMGGEKKGWYEKRAEDDKKAMEEGKAVSDLMIDQVKEVFGLGENKKGEDGAENGQPKGTDADEKKP